MMYHSTVSVIQYRVKSKAQRWMSWIRDQGSGIRDQGSGMIRNYDDDDGFLCDDESLSGSG